MPSIYGPQRSRIVLSLHWEDDLIKGAGNRSSVGTLVERTIGFVVLVQLDNATIKEVVDSFASVLNHEPASQRACVKL